MDELRKTNRAPETASGASAKDDLADDLQEVFALELRGYLVEVREQLRLLESAGTRAVSCQRLNRIFHTIKGSAALVGWSELSAVALQLERFFGAAPTAPDPDLETAQENLGAVFDTAGLEAPSLVDAWRAAPEGSAPGGENELLEAFHLDALEGLGTCDQLLVQLERKPRDREILQAVFRHFHGLKGAAAAVGLRAIADLLHEGESLLEAELGDAPAADAAGVLDRLFALTAAINREVDATTTRGGGAPEAAPDSSSDALPVESESVEEETLTRVPVARLDELMAAVAQLAGQRAQLEQKLHLFADLREKLHGCRRRLAETADGLERGLDDAWMPGSNGEEARGSQPAWRGGGAASRADGEEFTELEFDKYDDATVLSRSVIEAATDSGELADEMARLIDTLGEQARQIAKVTTGLQRQVTALRLLPLGSVFRRLAPAVRDAARETGKRVDLQVGGGDVQLDRSLIEALHAPLLHLVRNAVSHGIEAPDRRRATGKSESGSVRLSAVPEQHGVVVTVEDDGAGLDFDAVRARAWQLGLLGEGETPSREQLLRLIFEPGFSTAAATTDLAGRGMGLDAVARQVAAFHGDVAVESRPGEGTAVRLFLPLATSIDETLMVETGAQVFAVPIRFVERAVPIEMRAVERRPAGARLRLGERMLPALVLGPLVGEAVPADAAVAVSVRVGDRVLALVVDGVRAQQEVSIRPLSPLLEAHPFLTGATIAGSGSVVFVLHVGHLIDLTLQSGPASAGALPADASEVPAALETACAVLVVDDSISVRKLVTRLLQREGYEVETAVDGIDALEKLAQRAFRVVITDLEMPRMHGYELIEAIRRRPRWSGLPVIVCTSRSSDKHRRHARELGATGYVTKPFTPEDLAAEVNRVLAPEVDSCPALSHPVEQVNGL